MLGDGFRGGVVALVSSLFAGKPGSGHGGEGDGDEEGGAFAGGAIEGDGAFAHFDGAFSDVEADAGAFTLADVGGAEEGFEHAVFGVFGDTDAVVLDTEAEDFVGVFDREDDVGLGV